MAHANYAKMAIMTLKNNQEHNVPFNEIRVNSEKQNISFPDARLTNIEDRIMIAEAHIASYIDTSSIIGKTTNTSQIMANKILINNDKDIFESSNVQGVIFELHTMIKNYNVKSVDIKNINIEPRGKQISSNLNDALVEIYDYIDDGFASIRETICKIPKNIKLENNIKIFTVTGTHTYNVQISGMYLIELWGGGEGGGSLIHNNGGNGGQGGFYLQTNIVMIDGKTLKLTIGQGGSGGIFKNEETKTNVPNDDFFSVKSPRFTGSNGEKGTSTNANYEGKIWIALGGGNKINAENIGFTKGTTGGVGGKNMSHPFSNGHDGEFYLAGGGSTNGKGGMAAITNNGGGGGGCSWNGGNGGNGSQYGGGGGGSGYSNGYDSSSQNGGNGGNGGARITLLSIK